MPFRDRMPSRKLGFARSMAARPTPSEAALWERLKAGRLGVGFLFQELVLGHIADFYCPAAKLVVEVDGPIHSSPDQRARDSIKDRALRWRGLHVLRLDTTMTTDQMIERIDLKLHFLQVERRPQPGPADNKAA